MKKLALHWKIMIGMVLGIVFGIMASKYGFQDFTADWIKPIGTIFISLLKLIAIPLIIGSLIKGISDLKDISQFSKMGLRTMIIYVVTTMIAISIGLAVVNIIQPGEYVSTETVSQLTKSFEGAVQNKIEAANNQQKTGPLQFVVEMVPSNIFSAASNNGKMLQVIVFVIFFGIALLLIDPKRAKPVKDFFDGVNDVILKMVDLIMLMAPYAVFALLASLVAETTNPDLFAALGWYAASVVIGLLIMIAMYLTAVYLFTGRSPFFFIKAISPAQLLAFSTSSSAATLPVTMERVEEHLGVEKEVTSFVLPVGATINMDGTSLYQAVAAVFICQALDFDLTFGDQLTIILTATMASIGSAAVPGAGMVMLVIVLESLGLPAEKLAIGLALIFAVDRPLDMCRTVINVTGDATVAMIVGNSLGKLGEPNVKNWDDNKEYM
ncbi:MAG: dicarboxylate/amino acid:cation symporter [Saprospiraceae bacterium]